MIKPKNTNLAMQKVQIKFKSRINSKIFEAWTFGPIAWANDLIWLLKGGTKDTNEDQAWNQQEGIYFWTPTICHIVYAIQ